MARDIQGHGQYLTKFDGGNVMQASHWSSSNSFLFGVDFPSRGLVSEGLACKGFRVGDKVLPNWSSCRGFPLFEQGFLQLPNAEAACLLIPWKSFVAPKWLRSTGFFSNHMVLGTWFVLSAFADSLHISLRFCSSPTFGATLGCSSCERSLSVVFGQFLNGEPEPPKTVVWRTSAAFVSKHCFP